MAKPDKAIIVECSQGDAEALYSMLKRCAPPVEVSAICTDLRSAKEDVRQYDADILFLNLDFPLPGSAWDVLKQIEDDQLDVILTSAKPSSQQINALIEMNIERGAKPVRFLSKPFNSHELAALLEALRHAPLEPAPRISEPSLPWSSPAPEQKWVVRIAGEDYLRLSKTPPLFIPLNAIYYCKADGNYVQVFAENGGGGCSRKIIRCTIGMLSGLLEPYGFFRTHASYLVNLQRIDATKVSLTNGDSGSGGYVGIKNWDNPNTNGVIPLARSRKQAFREVVGVMGASHA
jgi:two-component system, LytTR family, response regulator